MKFKAKYKILQMGRGNLEHVAREVVEASSLERFKAKLDGALSNLI